jgi:lactate dehydrogenase-like 2-hydroxyacid dehydrogenase
VPPRVHVTAPVPPPIEAALAAELELVPAPDGAERIGTDIVLAPHLGSATAEAREAMGMLVLDGLRAVLLEERVPENAVT